MATMWGYPGCQQVGAQLADTHFPFLLPRIGSDKGPETETSLLGGLAL